jgi:hypothetical protein
MLYIAEITSTAIRLNATWALTPAAMSLLRDRYEQTVRFSWLVRNGAFVFFELCSTEIPDWVICPSSGFLYFASRTRA